MSDVNEEYHQRQIHRFLKYQIPRNYMLSDEFRSENTFTQLRQLADVDMLKELFLSRDQSHGVVSKRTLIHPGCLHDYLAEGQEPITIKKFTKTDIVYEEVQFETTDKIPVIHFNHDFPNVFSGRGIVTFKAKEIDDGKFQITGITSVKRLSSGYFFEGKFTTNEEFYFE